MILKESNNVFKTDPKDRESRLTQRIATADVDPTIDWLNKTFGFKFVDADKLGSTGKKVKPDGTFEENSSGDIDLNVDIRELPKEEIIAKLSAWCQKQGIPDLEIMNKGRTFTAGWIANAGLQVHFRTPIKGNPKNGFVQTDFMLTDNPKLQMGAKRGGTEHYTGADRAVLLSSLARGRGYKFSPTRGVVDPNNGDAVVADDWDEIAEILLGKGAKEPDTHTVESMLAKLKGDPNYNELIAPWKENMEKQGKIVPEHTNALRAGIKIAERRRTDEFVGKALKGIAKTAARSVGDVAMSAKGGYAAGKAAGSGVDAMSQAYGAAGGRKTTIGQTSSYVSKKWDAAKKKLGIDKSITGRSGADKADDATSGNQNEYTDTYFWSDKAKAIIIQTKNGSWVNTTTMKPIDKKVGNIAWKKSKDKGGKLIESLQTPLVRKLNEAARIDHIEDLIFDQGAMGAVRGLEALKNLEQGGHKDVTIKWDGSPAIVFGRNENGEFVFTDKSGFVKKGGVERATSGEDLEQNLLNRSGGANREDPKRKAFAAKMKDIFTDYEKATPKDFRGYFKGDLLYYNTPPVEDGHYVFTPQIVTYKVDVNSDLGKRIGRSKTGIVIHREVDEEGNEGPLKDTNIFRGNDVLVVPPVYVDDAPPVDNANIQRLANIIKKDSADINKLMDINTLTQRKIKDFGKILYAYTNSKVDTGLDNLGKDFVKWVDSSTLSQRKKLNVIEYVKENMNAFTSLWEVVTGIMKVKDQVIKDLDSQGGAVKAFTAGKPGGEGYVIAHPEGDLKLVNRSEFTAANRAVKR